MNLLKCFVQSFFRSQITRRQPLPYAITYRTQESKQIRFGDHLHLHFRLLPFGFYDFFVAKNNKTQWKHENAVKLLTEICLDIERNEKIDFN